MNGYFTLPGLTDRPYIYSVTHLSEGKSYCTRNVTVRQPKDPSPLPPPFGKEDAEKDLGKICFSCICSFKRDERETFEGHQGTSVQERWEEVLGQRDGGSWPVAPGVDAPW